MHSLQEVAMLHQRLLTARLIQTKPTLISSGTNITYNIYVILVPDQAGKYQNINRTLKRHFPPVDVGENKD